MTSRTDPTPTVTGAPQAPDLREQLFAAQDWCADLVERVEDAHLLDPTPCQEFDVRHLLGHIGTVYEKVTGFGRHHADPYAGVVRSHEDYEALYERVAADRIDGVSPAVRADFLRSQVADARDAWTVETLDADIALGWGPSLPGRVVTAIYLMEVLVHGWDLASATGLPHEAPVEVAEAGLSAARDVLPAAPRGMANGVPFDPVVDPAPGAGPTERLANWAGRVTRGPVSRDPGSTDAGNRSTS